MSELINFISDLIHHVRERLQHLNVELGKIQFSVRLNKM
jgi:hypothetical protein